MISRRMARSATSEMVQGDGYGDGSRRWIKRISKAIEKREDLKNEDKSYGAKRPHTREKTKRLHANDTPHSGHGNR